MITKRRATDTLRKRTLSVFPGTANPLRASDICMTPRRKAGLFSFLFGFFEVGEPLSDKVARGEADDGPISLFADADSEHVGKNDEQRGENQRPQLPARPFAANQRFAH